jgi:hypothetical protein
MKDDDDEEEEEDGRADNIMSCTSFTAALFDLCFVPSLTSSAAGQQRM